MSVTSQAQIIDELIAKAEKALEREQFFEAERLGAKALHMAREDNDFTRMARVVPALADARRMRLDRAAGAETVTILAEPVTEETKVVAGCYLVRPPMVGADARRLRLAAHGRDIAVAVLCHEPLIRIKLLPIVAISTGVTIRTKVDPPADLDQPDIDWYLDALEALGDAALDTIDPEQDVEKRIDALLGRIDAIPDHLELHQCLLEACEEAAKAASPANGAK